MPRKLLLALSLCLLGAAGWYTGVIPRLIDDLFLRRWLHGRIEELRAELQPSLPFTIVDWSYDARMEDLKRGRISEVSLTLERLPYRLRLRGPLELDWISEGNAWVAVYRPKLEASGAWALDGAEAELSVAASTNLEKLIRFGLRLDAERVSLAALGVKAEKPHLEGGWGAGTAILDFTSDKAEWIEPGNEMHSGELTGLKLSAEAPLEIQPVPKLGEPAIAELGVKGGVLAWDALLLERKDPLQVSIEGRGGDNQPWQELTARARIGGAEQSVILSPGARGAPLALRWKLARLPLSELWSAAATVPELAAATQAWKLKAGTLETQGSTRIRDGALEGTEAHVAFRGVRAENAKRTLAVKGLSLSFPVGPRTAAKEPLRLSIDRGYFQRFGFKLPAVEARLDFGEDALLPRGVDGEKPLVWDVNGHVFRFAAIRGRLRGEGDTLEGIKLETGLETKPIPFEFIRAGICGNPRHTPPGRIHLRFPRIELLNGWLDPQGSIEAELFDGRIRITEIGVFDPFSSRPESSFTAEWGAIRLDQFGAWIGFGEMKGQLQGYARKVALVGTFPIQFNFRVEAKPLESGDIVFSPDAMKNTVRLFANEEIDQLPGVAQWLAFGWPSRLFGGYDVDYAGISIYSHEGSILIETLDPPDVYVRERKRYILYGRRFKMPLQSQRYPLVVDATAMGNFFQHVTRQIDQLSAAKASKGDAPQTGNAEPTETPDETPHCLVPSDF